MKIWMRLTLTLIVCLFCGAAQSQSFLPALTGPDIISHWQVSPYTLHFHPSDDHKPVVMAGLEREHTGGKLDGLVLFSNSFGQESAFIYPWGQVYKNFYGIENLSFKWTAGLLYGYKEPYENKVPLNYKGFSPGAIIALAYEFKPGWQVQVDALGTAGLMFQLNVPY